MKQSIVLCILLISFLLAGCGRKIFTGKREARGVWMSRFEYANKDPEVSKQKIRTVFERARTARFNMVFFQVRGNGDAFYKSSYEPWAASLTDSLGKDPGWDPLEFAVGEAHRLGLEIHAWTNVFPYWRGPALPPSSEPPQPYRAHPEWIVCDKDGKPMSVNPPANDYIWASPGIPAVRQHVRNVVMDIVNHYDIDGIHFDYVRYPEGSPVKGYSHDSVSIARFGSPEGNPEKLAWDHWQREQVNQFVIEAYNDITAAKPWVKVSASVIGKYMGTGWTSYNAVYQDPRRWMEVGKIDFIVPMVYWERSHPTHPFIPLITQWQDRVAYDRQVLPGLATRLIDKYGYSEIEAEIRETRRLGLPGVVFFSAGGLQKAWETLGVNEFPYWSLIPQMPWKDSTAPPPPLNVAAHVQGNALSLQWNLPSSDKPLSFVIYRSTIPEVSRDDVFAIADVTGRNATSYVDDHYAEWDSDVLYYMVTSVDRLGNESAPTPVVTVRPRAATVSLK